MTQPSLFAHGPAGGFATRDGALDAFELFRHDWVERAREIAAIVCAERGTVTADDIHERLGVPPGVDGRIIGALFRRGFELVGYRKSKRDICHHRAVGIFRVKECRP